MQFTLEDDCQTWTTTFPNQSIGTHCTQFYNDCCLLLCNVSLLCADSSKQSVSSWLDSIHWIPGNLDMTLLIASITAWIKRSPSSQCAVHVFLQMLDNVSTEGDNLQLTSQWKRPQWGHLTQNPASKWLYHEFCHFLPPDNVKCMCLKMHLASTFHDAATDFYTMTPLLRVSILSCLR